MRYEINDTQKINKWEEFLNNYSINQNLRNKSIIVL